MAQSTRGKNSTGTTAPTVSVVIPAYNAERWIGLTLDSVRAQTFTDFEIIVVIDGATDGTIDICRDYAAQDARIIIHEIENGGVARARNAGIAIARGEFIAPLDADDLWHPTRLALHVAALRQHGDDYAMAYSPHISVNEAGIAGQISQSYCANGYAFGAHLCANFVGNGSGTTVRTAALRAVGGYSSVLRDKGGEGSEDYLVQSKLAYAYKIVCVPDLVIGYRRSEGNMSSNALRMRYSRLLMLSELEDFATSFPHSVFLHPRALAVLGLMWQYVRRRKWRTAAALALEESRRNPLVIVYTPFLMLETIRVMVMKLVRRALRLMGAKAGHLDIPFAAVDPTHFTPPPYPIGTRAFIWLYNRIERNIRRRDANGSHRAWDTKAHGDEA